ncbi:hypothetical protein CR956_00965 [Candidatus Saccharibacteria bacterium]|nr:MAG: hypothetical protein CR956_00965 [Candidatus Saccharibacteria bacterium]
MLAFELLGGPVTSELLERTVEQAMSCTTSVESLLANPPILDKLTVLMTYHTNSIEGSTMTLADNQKVILEQKTLRSHSAREQLEARNHSAALLWVLDTIAEGEFSYSEDYANQLHVRLMNGLVTDSGEYRRHGVRIMGSCVAVANYQKVPTLMGQLFSKNMPKKLADIARFHAEFEKIHPYSDGNGRVGRLLVAGLCLQQNGTPPIITRQARASYYKYLEIAQTKQDFDPLTYLLAREAIATHRQIETS